jgi:hypothetical protein
VTTVADALIYELSLASFGASVRAAVRGLWRGETDQGQFVDQMTSAISRGIEQAWIEGAGECGIGRDERTPEETAALRAIQDRSIGAIQSFGVTISQATRADGAKLGPHLSRAESWTNRYNEARNQARAMACADVKYRWDLGEADHCSSCLKLSGKIKRASQWAAADVRPQHSALECGGFKCACGFTRTDEPLSRGRIPGIP